MSDQRSKQPHATGKKEQAQEHPQQQQPAEGEEIITLDDSHEPQQVPQTQELAELERKYQLAVADLANAHKRFQQERQRLGELAVVAFVGKLLPMADNMAHSLRSAQESHDTAALIEGFKLVEAQMLQILRDRGVTPIESVGKPFDPGVHHAVTMEVTDKYPPGTVVEELSRGFVLGDFVIRPAQVKVAAAVEEEGPPGADK